MNKMILVSVLSLAAAGAVSAQTATDSSGGGAAATAPAAAGTSADSSSAMPPAAAGGDASSAGSAGAPAGSSDAGSAGTAAGSSDASASSAGAAAVTAGATNPEMANLTAQQFVEMAASSGLFEVKSSELALERAKSDDVKAFAQMMIDDHTKANKELMTIAMAKNLPAPAEPTGPAAEHMAAVMAAEGDGFDAVYMEHQVKAHAEAIMLFQAQSVSNNDADLAAFAAKTLPTLQMHAEHAQGMGAK
ncbi:DUF4142 domain-containing protein [Paracoccus endophyticus]|uniref:DUF4142 domain-containing protein n=1 Tax=Paracoccus endophyticus TaxID=2233774 RepID=UPI0013A6E6C3|nr:DUF4142 domain-containing protein [Paracoccus endophyticus]